MKKKILFTFFLLSSFSSADLACALEYTTTLDDQQGVSVTIYNSDMALVKDQRKLSLPEGEFTLAFKEISANIKPETALLNSTGLAVLEQNFEYDLLTPQAMLMKYVGREVSVVTKHPTTGEETIKQATVLSAQEGQKYSFQNDVVLKMADHIETGVPGRLIFPDVPENLRDRPTLTMLVENNAEQSQEVELSYLTSGLSWKADYVAELSPDDKALNLRGWVTLDNKSGASYVDAHLQLVAGDVNMIKPERMRPRSQEIMINYQYKGASPAMAEEQMFEYHLYSLDRQTTIKDNQTKQVSLLQANQVACRKEFILDGSDFYYRNPVNSDEKKEKISVYMELQNRDEYNLGMPLPKGIVRVYKKDRQDRLQFIGEDSIDHTPKNETLRLKLGEAFDIKALRTNTDFSKIEGSTKYNYIYESSHQIELKNGKDEDITVKVAEPVPGDWQILSESHPHEKASANKAVWYVMVPGLGKTVLSYQVRVRY